MNLSVEWELAERGALHLVFVSMQLFLFRHGERDNSFAKNQPLNSRGREQAQMIAQEVASGSLPRPQLLFVSPKIRTQQTFAPTAQLAGIELQVVPELDERLTSESAREFTERVRFCLSVLESQTAVTYACSHLDWLEEALPAIPSPENLLTFHYESWAPAQFLEFEIRDGLWNVRRLGPI